ncbi:DUF3972 domain-containing protein [Helicobacter suis]|uniref:DUF3972 domain-containing protein n=1 Tax=Helicobacter suis TaxID=104628 RepID=A0ABM7KX48_9HELI|nr:DUF3972 domain-containing protein [Helicobacter suis]BCD46898.1 DUF3972 domain-containing protein [Helicobacter suis]BCD48656.1 DUF3972 domain-containing protein [Helicobacter suis]BCD50432.1 DUF3972 domain-containing protein [Helicobacter suis]BDR27352.1 hypothetical protein HSHS1_01130 [Helicobacter suis HS1]
MEVEVDTTQKETWVTLDEFLDISKLPKDRVLTLIQDQSIVSKHDEEQIWVDLQSATQVLAKKAVHKNTLVATKAGYPALVENMQQVDPVFVEKTINTILGLHDKVVSAKDEAICAYKNENVFLKDAVISMQEVYEEDKRTIEVLQEELSKVREEVEFMKRKYRLMWGKVTDMGNLK